MTCGNANVEIANLACRYSTTPQYACEAAIPLVSEICCVPDESNSAPVQAPTPPAQTETTPAETGPAAEALAELSPGEPNKISTGAIVGIVVGAVLLFTAFIVVQMMSSKSGPEYD